MFRVWGPRDLIRGSVNRVPDPVRLPAGSGELGRFGSLVRVRAR